MAKELHAKADRPNLFIKIPGTPEGLPAIEEAIFAGVPVNVTLLFSREHYVAAADAYLKGIERRIAAGLKADVASVASVFISRWDAAVTSKVPEAMHNTLGIAIARRTYKAYVDLLASPRWRRAHNEGVRPQRLLWASTGTKDPKASDILYVKDLAAPYTINTMPEKTLKAFADHGEVGALMSPDGGDCEEVLAAVREGRRRPHRPGRPAPARGGRFVRQVLERVAGGDRVQERVAQEGELNGFSKDSARSSSPASTLPHEGGGLQLHLPPPSWGRVGAGGGDHRRVQGISAFRLKGPSRSVFA